MWDSRHGCLSQVLKQGHKCAVVACRFTSNNTLATCDISGMLVIWNLDTKIPEKDWPKKYALEMDLPDADITIVIPEFSVCGRYLALRPLHEVGFFYTIFANNCKL